MIKNLADIEKALSLPTGALDEAIKSTEEKVIDISNLEILKREDYESRIKNIKEETSIAAVEIAVKKARAEKGLAFEGKTIENLLEAQKSKVIAEANLNPDKKVSELEKDLSTMRMNFENANKKLIEVENEFKQKENFRTIKDTIISEIPANTIIPKEDVINIFFSKNKAELSENGSVIFKRGEDVLKNQITLNPLTVKEVMKEFITPYIAPPTGGGGGTDNPGQNKPGTYEAFAKDMEKLNIMEGSIKFNEEMSKRIKEKTLVI